MTQKEEDTVVLLSPKEVEEESEKEFPRRSLPAAGITSSLLCGAGIFIATTVVWCHDHKGNCKDSEIFRVTALFGGIISSLLLGRAVDYYGRRPSLIFSVLLWILVTIFMLFLPSQTEMHGNSYAAPLSKFYLWPSRYKSSLDPEYAPSYTIKTYDTEVSVSHIISYTYSHNSSFANHLFPTQPTPVKSLSIENHITNDSLSIDSFSTLKGKMLEYSSMKSSKSNTDMDKYSFWVLLLSFHLFLGSASASSVVTASVYIYEISPSDSQACWLSLSNFFSSLFILCLPIIHDHLILLATAAWLPIIALCFLMLIPVNIPSYLSLPQSPHFLLLSLFVQRRNSTLSNSVINSSCESKVSSVPGKESESRKFGSIFQSYGNATLGYIQTPFKKAKIKIYDASSKSSASDSDDSSCFYNEKLKPVFLESRHEHMQSANMESEGGNESINFHRSKMTISRGHPCAALAENKSACEKSLGAEAKCCGSAGEESVNLIEDEVEDCEEESTGEGTLDLNETNYGSETLGESANLVQQSWTDSQNPVRSWKERESLRILSYLNGEKEGYIQWRNIKKVLKEDASVMKYASKKKFFNFDISCLCSTFCLVAKVGLPLMIIHLFSCEYGAVVTLSETIMSKLGFCGYSGPATIISLQVVSSAASVLILDKLRNQMVLKGAAIYMTASLITLGFLLPSIQKTANDEQLPISQNVVTPNPALPTLYPLLPTPLPQVFHGEENICSSNLADTSQLQMWDHIGTTDGNQESIQLNSSVIWISAVLLILYVLVSSLVLLPLTRLVLVSYFPIDKRGSGIGVSLSLEWVSRLIIVFFPCSFLNSGLGFLLYAVASFSSIIMLCVANGEFFSAKVIIFQQASNEKRMSHHSSYDRVCNLSDINSTAV